MSEDLVKKLAADVGGKIEEMQRLPDGSGFAVMSMPLPKNHWLYVDTGFEPPPMTHRLGTAHPDRKVWEAKIRAAAQFAVRAATMKGKEMDFDPDAIVQNMIVGMLGYYTPDGLDRGYGPANPPSARPRPSRLHRVLRALFPWAFAWRVRYHDGQWSEAMRLGTARGYAEIFGGEVRPAEDRDREDA